MSATTTGQGSVSPSIARGGMSVEEYVGLIESGVIDEKAPVVLIEGRIVGKMTKGRKHSSASQRIQDLLTAALGVGSGWVVRMEKPVAISGRKSMPEPDASLARGTVDDYEDREPGPEDVGLVVEVADSSLAADRELAATYIGGGVPVYWVVNIPDRRLEVYSAAGVKVLVEGDAAELVLDGVPVARIAVADMLPRRKAD